MPECLCAAACVADGGVAGRGQDEETQRAVADLCAPGLHAELPGSAVPDIVIEEMVAAVEACDVSGVPNAEEYVADAGGVQP